MTIKVAATLRVPSFESQRALLFEGYGTWSGLPALLNARSPPHYYHRLIFATSLVQGSIEHLTCSCLYFVNVLTHKKGLPCVS